MDLKQLLGLAAQTSLVLTVLSFGLRATRDDALYLIYRPSLLVRTLLAMFVITPILVFVLLRAFNVPRLVEVTLIALAISPVPPLLPRKLGKAGATSGYGVGLLVTAALASLLIVPLWIRLLAAYTGQPLIMPPQGLARMILTVIVIPLGVGILIRRVLPGVAARFAGIAEKLGGALLAVIAVVLVLAAAPAMWNLMGSGTLAIMTAFVLIGLAVGHLLGSPDTEHQGVLAIATATRHPGIALALLSANFPEDRFGGVVLLYLIVAAIVCVPYIKWQQIGPSPRKVPASGPA